MQNWSSYLNFKMVLNLQLLLQRNNADEKMIAGRSWSKKRQKQRQKLASCSFFMSETWISATYKTTIPLPYRSLRFFLLRTLKTSFSQRNLCFKISSHIPCGPKTAILLTKSLKKRRKKSSVIEMLSKLVKILSLLPVSMHLTLPTIFIFIIDSSLITYYNQNKKGYYVDHYSKSRKNT